MAQSLSEIWIHAIWATKDREELISRRVEKSLFPFMIRQFEEMGCPVRIMNGTADHVHCLFRLSKSVSLAALIKQVKGSSAAFLNESILDSAEFYWQSGYAAFSVDKTMLPKIERYIRFQKEHHRKHSSKTEYDVYLDEFGLRPK